MFSATLARYFRNINPWSVFAGALLVTMALLRQPTPEPIVRFGFFLVAAWAVVLAISALVAARGSVWVGLFLACCLVGSVPHTFLFTDHGWELNAATAYTQAGILFGCLWFYFLRTTDTREEYLLNALCVVGFVNSLFVIAQVLSSNRFFPGVGLMGNPNLSAALTAMCFPAFFRKYWRCGLIAVVPALVMLRSFGGMAAAGAAVFVLLLWHRRWLLAVLVPVAAVAAFWVFVDSPGFHGRVENYAVALAVAKYSPWYGLGVGQWKVFAVANKAVFAQIPVYAGLIPTTVHNDLLQLYVEAPYALVPVVGFVVARLIKWRQVGGIPLAALAAVFVSAMVSFPFHIATTGMVAVTWLAIASGGVRWGKS